MFTTHDKLAEKNYPTGLCHVEPAFRRSCTPDGSPRSIRISRTNSASTILQDGAKGVAIVAGDRFGEEIG
jgi:hypothetical protein